MRTALIVFAALIFSLGIIGTASAVVSFDQDVTGDVIFGDGNANGSWTVDRANDVELGLRAKLRFDSNNDPQNIFNSDGAGTYTFKAGLPPSGFSFAPFSTSSARWNFEWAINSNETGTSGLNLDDLSYVLRIDFDRSSATNFLQFDPINIPAPAFGTHAIGTNATGNGDGTVAGDSPTYLNLIADNNVAQNSWNMEFFDDGGGFFFDGAVSGEYTFELEAFSGATSIAKSTITVMSVPEPSAFLFGGLVCTALGINYSRKRRNADRTA